MKWETKNGTEFKAILLWTYIAVLVLAWIRLGSKGALLVHLISVGIFSIFYFGWRFIYILVSPLMPVLNLFIEWRISRFVKKLQQTHDPKVAVVVGYSDWKTFEG